MAAVERSALSSPVGHRPALARQVLRGLAALWRTLRNREEMRKLSDLSDWELADIGLTRDDLMAAYEMPFTTDPTRMLDRRARERAALEAAARRIP